MYEYEATLIEVIDGDTIDVWVDLGFSIRIKQRLRFAGINTPELHSTDEAEKARAQAAKDRLVALLPQVFVIKTKKDKREKFGRMLAEVFVGEQSINTQMVTEGFAKNYDGGSRDENTK